MEKGTDLLLLPGNEPQFLDHLACRVANTLAFVWEILHPSSPFSRRDWSGFTLLCEDWIPTLRYLHFCYVETKFVMPLAFCRCNKPHWCWLCEMVFEMSDCNVGHFSLCEVHLNHRYLLHFWWHVWGKVIVTVLMFLDSPAPFSCDHNCTDVYGSVTILLGL
jgi:hypothetical protein